MRGRAVGSPRSASAGERLDQLRVSTFRRCVRRCRYLPFAVWISCFRAAIRSCFRLVRGDDVERESDVERVV
jgi:hypothetical protein